MDGPDVCQQRFITQAPIPCNELLILLGFGFDWLNLHGLMRAFSNT